MFASVVGVMFDGNDHDTIKWNERPKCVLVRPDDADIDVGWDAQVRNILRQDNVEIQDEDGSYVPITESQISEICDSLKRVMPIRYESKKFSDEDGNYAKKFWAASIPLRLARAVTVHKVQGMTLDKLMFTPGSAKMTGTSLTAFTRCKGGFEAMLIMGNDDDEHLVEQFNRKPSSDDYDLVKITEKLERNYQATLGRLENDALFQAVSSGVQQTELTTVRFG